MAGTPGEPLSRNFLLVLLEGAEDSVVAFEDVGEGFEVLTELWVLDVLS